VLARLAVAPGDALCQIVRYPSQPESS